MLKYQTLMLFHVIIQWIISNLQMLTTLLSEFSET